MAGIAPTPIEAAASADCRCLCGNLLARLVDGGVEVKCRRCKRTLLLPIEGSDAGGGQRGAGERPVRRV